MLCYAYGYKYAKKCDSNKKGVTLETSSITIKPLFVQYDLFLGVLTAAVLEQIRLPKDKFRYSLKVSSSFVHKK